MASPTNPYGAWASDVPRIRNEPASDGAVFPNLPCTGTAGGIELNASVARQANEIAYGQVEEYNAKLAVFRASCVAFEETPKQFPSRSKRKLAQQFSVNFLEFWKRVFESRGVTLDTLSDRSINDAAKPLLLKTDKRKRLDLDLKTAISRISVVGQWANIASRQYTQTADLP
ncbi:hypothetical protein QQS21_007097 [Conoideocrella luteorostrata]|uniref:Uncharacterized protein n=1 Tax=Conoideocrella luteorostrata TaxID=1105319 RepID=A0AAJ0CPC7_9HYPO|nr:hypothetical protein QQS21_007097 [Conoideocrella luteorostrata]